MSQKPIPHRFQQKLSLPHRPASGRYPAPEKVKPGAQQSAYTGSPGVQKIALGIVGVSGSGEAACVSDTASDTMTNEELISRAKRNIESGETSRSNLFRAAAEDIALARKQ